MRKSSFANQLGYGLRNAKIAVAFSQSALPPAFSVVETDGQKVAFEGKAKPVTGVKWGQFENHAELDFSALKAPGRYVFRVGESQSLPFTIGAAAYGELPDQLLEFMREQRCGYNPWLDAVCHPFDGRTAYGPLTNGTLSRRPRRLARCGGLAEVSAHLGQCHGADAPRL